MATKFLSTTAATLSAAVWWTTSGGTTTTTQPGVGDTAELNGHNITSVDTNWTLDTLKNTLGGTATVNGNGITITCAAVGLSSGSGAAVIAYTATGSNVNTFAGSISGNGGSNTGVVINSGTGTLNCVGSSSTLTGGSSSGTSATLFNSTSGVINLSGTFTGTAGSANGANCISNSGTGLIIISGTVSLTGGSVNAAIGILNSGTGEVRTTGTLTMTGGAVAGAYGGNNTSIGTFTLSGAGASTTIGNGWGVGSSGLTACPGFNNASTGVCTITNAQYGSLGQSPTAGAVTITNSTPYAPANGVWSTTAVSELTAFAATLSSGKLTSASGSVTLDFTTLLPTAPIANSVGEALLFLDLIGGRVNTAQGGTANTITLDAGASSVAGAYVGDIIYLYGGTGGGIRGAGQRGTIVAFNTSTKVAMVSRTWDTIPDNTTKFVTFPQPLANLGLWLGSTPNALNSGSVSATDQYGNTLANFNQISNIGAIADAINTVAASFTLTTGTVTSGTYTDTFTENSTYHSIQSSPGGPSGVIDCYYQFSVGTNGVGTTCQWQGYIAFSVPIAVNVLAYNWGTTSWDQVGQIIALPAQPATDQEQEFALANSHTGTGANAGLVRIRFNNGSLNNVVLNTDRLLVGYTVPLPASLVAFAGLLDSSGHIQPTTFIAAMVDVNNLLKVDVEDMNGAVVTLNLIADTTLTRDWTAVATTIHSRSLLNAARMLRNRFSLLASPGFVSVYAEDDSTLVFTKAITAQSLTQGIVEG